MAQLNIGPRSPHVHLKPAGDTGETAEPRGVVTPQLDKPSTTGKAAVVGRHIPKAVLIPRPKRLITKGKPGVNRNKPQRLITKAK